VRRASARVSDDQRDGRLLVLGDEVRVLRTES
jgi:hypothetical protein